MTAVAKVSTTDELSTDINVITAEINAYQRVAGEAIFEIGRRLKGVRDNPKKYGFEGYRDWEKWCDDELGMPRRSANRFIQAFEQLGSTSTRLPSGKIYEIISLPDEIDRQQFVEQPHTIPSTGKSKTVDEMTVRELREVKRQLKAEQERVEKLEREKDDERSERERLEDELKETPKIEVRTEYVEVEVDNTPDDYDEVKRRLEEYHEKFGDIRNYDESITATHVQDMISATMSFKRAVKELARRFAYMTKYKDAINRMDHISKQEYNESVRALHELADSFEYLDTDNSRIIINQ